MHEFSVCRALIEQVAGLVHERNARRALKIVVRIGPLAGIEPVLLRQAYPLCSAGTCAEDAQLVIEDCAVRVRCQQCGAESDVPSNRLLCHACGNWRTQVVAGDEMLLVSVELETRSTPIARPSGALTCVAVS